MHEIKEFHDNEVGIYETLKKKPWAPCYYLRCLIFASQDKSTAFVTGWPTKPK